MDASYEQGTLLWYWFEYWFVAFGMFTTLLLAVLVAVRSTREPRDLLPSFFMVAAVLAALPLTFIRLGVDIASANHLAVGYMSLAGVLGSIVVGIPQLIGIGCVSDKKWKDKTSEEFKMTETICDYFDGMINEVSLATEECSRATLLAAEKLPPILHLITTYPDPRTRGARRAKRDFERTLKKYISGSKLMQQLLVDLDKGAENIRLRLVPARTVTAEIAKHRTRVSTEISSVSAHRARARVYFLHQSLDSMYSVLRQSRRSIVPAE